MFSIYRYINAYIYLDLYTHLYIYIYIYLYRLTQLLLKLFDGAAAATDKQRDRSQPWRRKRTMFTIYRYVNAFVYLDLYIHLSIYLSISIGCSRLLLKLFDGAAAATDDGRDCSQPWRTRRSGSGLRVRVSPNPLLGLGLG